MKVRFFATCGLAVLLTNCASRQNMLAPGGPGARSLAVLGRISFIAFAAATLVTWTVLAIAALRRRGSLDSHAPIDIGGGHSWLLLGGIFIPAVTFGALFLVTLLRMDDFPLHGQTQHAPEVRVVGHQWWWEVHYLGRSPHESFVTANEIHIPVGQPVELELESVDVIHSFWVPALHGKVDLIPGRENRLRIQADVPGTFNGECAEYCGAEHAHMRLMVVAEKPDAYAQWVTNQQAASLQPNGELAMQGRTLFETHACALCHTIRGTQALGTVGPDLTHLASRQRLAANSLPNQPAYLAAWIVHAQALKPQVVMPNITDFTGPEFDALLHFLEGLR